MPFPCRHRMASSEGRLYEVEDFGRWFADGAGRPCRVHGVLRVLSRAPSAQPDADWPSVSLVEGTFCSRRAFNEMVDERCGQAPANVSPFAVLIVGFDDLPGINRRNGYDATDELIAAVGRRLTTCLRAGDRIARHAGGKFAILMSLASADQLSTATSRLVRRLNGETFPTSAGPLPASARIGAASGAPQRPQRTPACCNAPTKPSRSRGKRPMRTAASFHAEPGARRIIADAKRRDRRRYRRRAEGAARSCWRSSRSFRRSPRRVGFEEALLRIRQSTTAACWARRRPDSGRGKTRSDRADRSARVGVDARAPVASTRSRRLSMNVSIATLRARDWLDRLQPHLRTRRARPSG